MKEHPNHALDLGDNHWLDWLVTDFESKERCGAIITHLSDKTETGRCDGMVEWAPTKFAREHPERLTEREQNQVRWTLEGVADEHITLSPSILCQCGDHGFIRDGKWVRA
jgi:hypothetical protein